MDSPIKLEVNNLRALKILGQGAMGTVFLVHDISSDPLSLSPFALKVVPKRSLSAERRARWEISVLSGLHHPFLPRLLSSADDPDFLAWSLPFCPGGDLHSLRLLHSDRSFSPSSLLFYLSELVLALSHLHSLSLVYRDLKPENVLIQPSGHLTLTDFDLSRRLSPLPLSPPQPLPKHRTRLLQSARVTPRKPCFGGGERCKSFVGTEEYVSPEMVRGDGYDFSVDWWALGVLAYEMLYGTTPFKGANRKETFHNILTKAPKLVGRQSEATDLIQRLLTKDPTKRLGYERGAAEIKDHAFFRGVRWDLLTEIARPPFIPDVEGFDLKAGGVSIRQHFHKKQPSPPSPHCRRTVSFTDF